MYVCLNFEPALLIDEERLNENEAGAAGCAAGSDDMPHRMFTFSMVNSYGSNDVARIQDDGQPIKFSGTYQASMVAERMNIQLHCTNFNEFLKSYDWLYSNVAINLYAAFQTHLV